jgi:hypothetical protein
MERLVDKFEKKKYKIAKELIKKKQISKGLRYLFEDIKLLNEKGLSKKEILEFINQELQVNIPLQSFYTFWRRHFDKLQQQKGNIRGEGIIPSQTPQKKPFTSPVINERQFDRDNIPKKEKIAQNGSKTPKTDKEVNDVKRKALDTLMKTDISVSDNDLKDLL